MEQLIDKYLDEIVDLAQKTIIYSLAKIDVEQYKKDKAVKDCKDQIEENKKLIKELINKL